MEKKLSAGTKETIIVPLTEEPTVWNITVDTDATAFILVTAFLPKTVEGTIHVHLTGSRASAIIAGVIIASENANINLHTNQHHAAMDTTSDLLVKAVIFGNAHVSYDGAIRVDHVAQKTNAYQRNENIVCSPQAVTRSKPSLEILANDVRCTHGATVGSIPEDQVWYLQTRGIPVDTGRSLILSGFLRTVLDRIPDESLKAQHETQIESLLGGLHV